MTTDELVFILGEFNSGRLSREEAINAMVARGALREYAEETLALHTGESEGDVVE
jgi:hypothetical protein